MADNATSRVKHTPGPWLREDRMVYALHDIPNNRGALTTCNRFWAYVQHIPSQGCDRVEAEANARLIAAAPDLLDIVRWVDHYTTQGEPCPICSTAPHRSDCGLAQTLRQIDGD